MTSYNSMAMEKEHTVSATTRKFANNVLLTYKLLSMYTAMNVFNKINEKTQLLGQTISDDPDFKNLSIEARNKEIKSATMTKFKKRLDRNLQN
ncbi:hypothetical protein KAH94_00220 [bacterium]|nr:hypothetical protein [bacterium]